MNVKSVVLLLAALLIAGATAFFARSLITGQETPQVEAALPKDTSTKVLVATGPLPVGHIIEPANVEWQPWPEEMLEASYFDNQASTAEELAGQVVRRAIVMGQPVTRGSVIAPGQQGFLAAALSPGMRAITVGINETSGVAGFVFPGDRVDLVLTQDIEREGSQPVRVAETVLRNVRVLAVDRDTNELSNAPQKRSSVTLEVTPKLVEKIAVAQRLGLVSLSLRALANNGEDLAASNGDAKPAGGSTDIASAGTDETAPLLDATLPSDLNPTYTLASEVSRFQDGARARQRTASSGKIYTPRASKVTVSRGIEKSDVAVGAN